MNLRFLPQSTPYDPAEDPPGSVDPLGTVPSAEQLAEILLPGLTARMWRVRLLTFAALAAEIAHRVAAGREDQNVNARLAFERLFVSSIARQEDRDVHWKRASRRLPGIGLARQALRSGDQPLESANFLKGQGVNGPFGVISRLSRDLGIVDDAGQIQRSGTELLLAWAGDQDLQGILDEEKGRTGADWIRELVRSVSKYSNGSQSWPRKSWHGWTDIAERLRPDHLGSREKKVVRHLLSNDPLGIRDRMIQRLANEDVFKIYRTAIENLNRGEVEKQIIAHGFIDTTIDDEVDRTIRSTIKLIDAYESVSGLLESIFRSLVWGLTRNNGHAPRKSVTQDPTLKPFLSMAHSKIRQASVRFERQLEVLKLDSLANKRGSVDFDRMHKLLDDSMAASKGVEECVSSVMDRHVRVQKEKNKGVWIEEDTHWTLMPGFGDNTDQPLWYDWFLHPYRITNVYDMLVDLGEVREVRVNAKDQSE